MSLLLKRLCYGLLSAALLIGYQQKALALQITIIGDIPIHADIRPGWNVFANPGMLYPFGNNRTQVMFSNLPVGTVIYRFDSARQKFSTNKRMPNGWEHPDDYLNPPDGAMIYNPTRQTFSVDYYANNAFQGSVTLVSGLNLVGNTEFYWLFADQAYLQAYFSWEWGSNWFVLEDGDVVFKFDPRRQIFIPHVFSNRPGLEYQGGLYLGQTEAFFVYTRHPRTIGYSRNGNNPFP